MKPWQRRGGGAMIEVRNVTMTYPSGKGIFDVDFAVKQGEVLGYLGPNGAGKTTTIRCLLGFTKPDAGTCSIAGLDCVARAPEIQKILGYIPGEIAFLDGMTGNDFLKFMSEMRRMKNFSRQKELVERFELDPRKEIKKFSKGMKQKLGIVTAFMHDPEVLILDEPTSGLDPLMQNCFVELILEQKKAGKTILMSSHMFEEVERTSDTVLIIKDGRIVKQTDVQSLKETQRKGYILKPKDVAAAYEVLTAAGYKPTKAEGDTLEVFIKNEGVDRFLKTAAQFTILNLDVKSQSLEDIFMHFYSKEGK
jgi:ABC-2 type transport system ATP-binding protein